MAKTPTGFVSLTSVARGMPDAATALADIRRIYFKTTRQTIEHDFAHAIELLKSLPDEESRAKAHVYMEGLAEMRKDWIGAGDAGQGGRKTGKSTPKKPKRSGDG